MNRTTGHRDQVAVGEPWAYRARGIDPLVEVRVVRIGNKKPARMLVRFVADEFEGREDWVPPARLKVPWTQVGDYIAHQQRWTAVIDASPIRHQAADYASSYIFGELVPSDIATTDINGAEGVSRIHDVNALAALLHIDPEQLQAEPLSFVDDEALIVPWSITELIASTAARRNPEIVLRHVDKDETAYRQKMTYGQTRLASRHLQSAHIDADWFAQELHQPYHQPYWGLLRTWCGTQATERHDELVQLRHEVTRVGTIAQNTIEALRHAGQPRLADRFQRELGVRADEIRND